jgi:predicted RNase H-like HicB family nuclease
MFLKPLIQYGNSGCTLPLRCFSYRSGDWFFAQCLDLNLMSRGHTEEEAVSRLQEQMFSYVATAFDGDLKGLVPRKASAPNWLRYYWHLLKQKIHHRGRQHSTGELRDVGTKILSHC